MQERDELLSEEQTNGVLVQELRATYRLTTAEMQVLARVHARLAENTAALPVMELVQEEHAIDTVQSMKSAPAVSTPTRQRVMYRRSWLRHFNTVAAVLFVALLVGALVLTFSTLNHARVGSVPSLSNVIRVVLVPTKQVGVPSQAALKITQTLLSKRLSSFGMTGAIVKLLMVKGQSRIQIEMPHFGGNERQTIDMLVETGVLDFWDTGYTELSPGESFDSSQYTQLDPGSKPLFTNRDIDPSAISVFHDPAMAGVPSISLMMKGVAQQRFQRYTASSIGQTFTITLDGKVLSSATINSAISGPFAIVTNLTQQQANALVAVLEAGPLPIGLQEAA